MKTNVVDQLQELDKTTDVTNKPVKVGDEKYVHELKKGKDTYILKGLKLKLLPLTSKDVTEEYNGILNQIASPD